MTWITEELAGTKDGSNKNFTISSTPVVASMSIFYNGIRLAQVAVTPMPGEAEYGVSGTNVVLGQPPAATNEWTQARYFTDQ